MEPQAQASAPARPQGPPPAPGSVLGMRQLGSPDQSAGAAKSESGIGAQASSKSNSSSRISHQRSSVVRSLALRGHNFGIRGWYWHHWLVVHCQLTRDHPMFELLVLLTILASAVLVGMQTYPQYGLDGPYSELFSDLNTVIVSIFTAEVVIKILAEGKTPLHYFRSNWNGFDFAVVLASYMPVPRSYFAVVRSIRLLRVLKLVRVISKLRVIVTGLVRSLSSIAYIALLLALVFYFWGVLGTSLFAKNDPVNFGTLHVSLLTLFRVATLEDWTDLTYQEARGCANYWEIEDVSLCVWSDPQPLISVAFFVSFVVIANFMVLNLVLGVILISVTRAKATLEEEIRLEKEEREEYLCMLRGLPETEVKQAVRQRLGVQQRQSLVRISQLLSEVLHGLDDVMDEHERLESATAVWQIISHTSTTQAFQQNCEILRGLRSLQFAQHLVSQHANGTGGDGGAGSSSAGGGELSKTEQPLRESLADQGFEDLSSSDHSPQGRVSEQLRMKAALLTGSINRSRQARASLTASQPRDDMVGLALEEVRPEQLLTPRFVMEWDNLIEPPVGLLEAMASQPALPSRRVSGGTAAMLGVEPAAVPEFPLQYSYTVLSEAMRPAWMRQLQLLRRKRTASSIGALVGASARKLRSQRSAASSSDARSMESISQSTDYSHASARGGEELGLDYTASTPDQPTSPHVQMMEVAHGTDSALSARPAAFAGHPGRDDLTWTTADDAGKVSALLALQMDSADEQGGLGLDTLLAFPRAARQRDSVLTSSVDGLEARRAMSELYVRSAIRTVLDWLDPSYETLMLGFEIAARDVMAERAYRRHGRASRLRRAKVAANVIQAFKSSARVEPRGEVGKLAATSQRISATRSLSTGSMQPRHTIEHTFSQNTHGSAGCSTASKMLKLAALSSRLNSQLPGGAQGGNAQWRVASVSSLPLPLSGYSRSRIPAQTSLGAGSTAVTVATSRSGSPQLGVQERRDVSRTFSADMQALASQQPAAAAMAPGGGKVPLRTASMSASMLAHAAVGAHDMRAAAGLRRASLRVALTKTLLATDDLGQLETPRRAAAVSALRAAQRPPVRAVPEHSSSGSSSSRESSSSSSSSEYQ